MLVFLICFYVYMAIILIRNMYISELLQDWFKKVNKVNNKMIDKGEYNRCQLEWYNIHFNQSAIVFFMFWVWTPRQMMKDKVIYDFVVDKLEK